MSELPSGWLSISLGDVGTLFCGQSPSATDVNVIGEGTLYVTGPEQWDGLQIHHSKWTTDPRRIVPDGCIFVTVKGAGVGKLFPGTACAIGRDVYAYLPHPEMDRAFALKALARNIDDVVAQARGTIPGLSKDHILDQLVGFPPLAEQRRIVAKLDALTARTARARADLDRIPALTARYRKAAFVAAFRGQLTKARLGGAETDHAHDPTGLFSLPDGWRWQVAASAVEPGADIVYGIIQPGPKLGDGVPYIRGTDIQGGKILVDQLLKTSPEIAARYERSKLKPGDVILGIIRATKVAVVPAELEGGNITQGTARFRPGPDISTDFLALWLEGPDAQNWLHRHYRGIDMPGLNLGDVRRLPVPIPPKAEQAEIVRVLHTALGEIDRLAAEAASARRLLKRLDQGILAKAFQGKLVPQDPADEPASVLLDRIRAERASAPKATQGRRKAAA